MKFTLQQIARALGAVAPDAEAAQVAQGWSVDSRTIQSGEVFFALRGPNDDGHAHLPEVWRKGAIAAVVDQASAENLAGAGYCLVVRDTLDALQQVAAWARKQWAGEIVAVTGSAGKTTTKDAIADLLSIGFPMAKSEGNLNNHIGLPLSLLRMDGNARVMVAEMGMNHAGEIRRLAEIARPNVGVVTNVGFAHVENFDSIEGVARAKRELIESLGPTGIAVLNADDARVAQFAQIHCGRTVFYGESKIAGVRAEDVVLQSEGAQFRVEDVVFHSHLPGRHNVSNILAGIATAGIYGIRPYQLAPRVAELQSAHMRGERFEYDGIVLYNDCYNSNPAAVRSMLDVLRDTPARRRIAVLGEMQELGPAADRLHREIGTYAAASGVSLLIGIQGKARETIAAAKLAGLPESYFFNDAREAGRYTSQLATVGDAVLFKGSRAVRVELALQEFMAGVKPVGGRS